MRLDAETYHTRLDDSQRDAVGEWLASFLGPTWQSQMITDYEVVNEGLVRIDRLGPPGTTVEKALRPPPVWLRAGRGVDVL